MATAEGISMDAGPSSSFVMDKQQCFALKLAFIR